MLLWYNTNIGDVMKLEENMMFKNSNLNEYACQDSAAIRFTEEESDLRPPFFRDIDRVIYSLSFIRYMDKTQVFTFQDHDHLSKRMIHVVYVSKIARTIGRALGLNEDLIEAAALGHDLGHTPFGHVGERIINDISLKHNEGYFNHNIQSVRLLMEVENYGRGHNLNLQTLDAIMCHNGELPLGEYHPTTKDKDTFLSEYQATYQDKDKVKELTPMTLEGCVVRVSDLIAYLGRDIEDGLRLNLITKDDIPKEITDVLGTTNREIINTIVSDVINNSLGKNYIRLSEDVFTAIKKLKAFNYENIYYKAYTKEEHKYIEEMLNTLFDTYLNDLKTANPSSSINKSYLKNMSSKYLENTKERIVLDYIAGMTDDFCIKEYNKICKTNHNKEEVEYAI